MAREILRIAFLSVPATVGAIAIVFGWGARKPLVWRLLIFSFCTLGLALVFLALQNAAPESSVDLPAILMNMGTAAVVMLWWVGLGALVSKLTSLFKRAADSDSDSEGS